MSVAHWRERLEAAERHLSMSRTLGGEDYGKAYDYWLATKRRHDYVRACEDSKRRTA